jgi:hypothetical protein
MSPPRDPATVLQSLTLEEKVICSLDSGGKAHALTSSIDHPTCWKRLLGDFLHPRQGTVCQGLSFVFTAMYDKSLMTQQSLRMDRTALEEGTSRARVMQHVSLLLLA